MSISVSAPGKAFLIGEYAVLDGGPAIVTAIDVRATAHAGANAPKTAVVRCAQTRVGAFLTARGRPDREATPVVETGGFTMGARKLGLGSSAAVTTAVIGYHLVAAGLDPTDPDLQSSVLELAMAAHAEAQGGSGSGADVAAAVLGGTLRVQNRKPRPFALPEHLHIGFVDAGAPADTGSFIRRVKAAATDHPKDYAAIVGELRQAAERFIEACSHTDSAILLGRLAEAIEEHNHGLRKLGALGEVPIMTPAIETIIERARSVGLAAKPSGAGGGDLVVVFATDRGQLDRFGEQLRRETGYVLLSDLRAHAEGLRAEERIPTNSRLAGFFKLSVSDRRDALAKATGMARERLDELDVGALDIDRANHLIENVVGTLELPLAVATNFRINGRDYLVPMSVEEASVVAAASNAAKMIRAGGGFAAHSDPPWMIAQVQLLGDDRPGAPEDICEVVRANREALLRRADEAHPRLLRRGGGARDVEVRITDTRMVVVHILVDCRDAMGANLLNTVAETVAHDLESLTGWSVGLRILSNLADRRCAHVSARVPPDALASRGFDGADVAKRIVSASRFAEVDPYRATTHNKGIMNGVDAVVLATGNDWRAMEASAHAYAARTGTYRPLATWSIDDEGWLVGTMSIPMANGIVGGATRVHPVCRLAIEIIGCKTSAVLGQVMAAAGLASNLAALRALATEGIQRGHMSLHARNIAAGAGAEGDEVERLAQQLIDCGEIKAERATELLALMRSST